MKITVMGALADMTVVDVAGAGNGATLRLLRLSLPGMPTVAKP